MRLYDFILENMEPILLDWEAFAREAQPGDCDMNVAELRDHAGEMLRVIAADMQISQTERERYEKSKGARSNQSGTTAAENHAIERLDSGFSISVLASEYRALRASVLKLWFRQGHGGQASAMEDIIRFNEAIDESLVDSIERYSEAVSMQRDVFIAILGHDLRTPLQSLSLGAQFLMHGEEGGSKLNLLGARMFKSVRRMTGMIDNLLGFTKSRIGGGMDIAQEETELSTVAEHVVDEFRSYNPDSDIHFDVKGKCIGEWDAGRLAQIFQNLIGNALQYGAQGKAITVSMEGQENQVVIKVHNHGAPIAEPEQQKLFDLLHRHAPAEKNGDVTQNLGLGLYIVREIAVAHGGDVDVTSSEEGGTTFKVRLPKNSSTD